MSQEPVQAQPQAGQEQLPRHVAIIMDGNGRWAKNKNLPRYLGHREGVKAVRRVVEACRQRGIEVLTLFAFSSENWRRPKTEVGLLMDLFIRTLKKEISRLYRNRVRVRFIGDRTAFDPKLHSMMDDAERQTARNDGLTLVIAANYGGRWDIVNACRKIARQVQQGALEPGEINDQVLAAQLSLSGTPDPDLFIRTGGERRISNFLLWQLAYTEFYFCDTLWPDFSETEMADALTEYSRRQRRYGKTGEQIEVPGEC